MSLWELQMILLELKIITEKQKSRSICKIASFTPPHHGAFPVSQIFQLSNSPVGALMTDRPSPRSLAMQGCSGQEIMGDILCFPQEKTQHLLTHKSARVPSRPSLETYLVLFTPQLQAHTTKLGLPAQTFRPFYVNSTRTEMAGD